MRIEPPAETRFLELTPQKMEDLWQKLASIRGVFDDRAKSRELFFANLMSRDTLWLERLDGNGILYLTALVPGLSALAHVVYWDKRLRGREGFTLNCIKWAVQYLDLKKVNVWLPDFAKAAIHFVEKIGFKREGKLRRWSISNGQMYDMMLFGMTNEEAFYGDGPVGELLHAPVVGVGGSVHQGTDENTELYTGAASGPDAGAELREVDISRGDIRADATGVLQQPPAEPRDDPGVGPTNP